MTPSDRASLEISRAAARALDRAAQERFGIPGIVLMENAAIGMTDAAAELARPGDGTIAIVCGSGNNGGDGYAMARHLANRDYDVELIPVGEPRKGSDAAINAQVCAAMSVRRTTWGGRSRGLALVVDALFGTGLDRAPAGAELEVIEAMNGAGVPIFAVDLPSGVDNDGGLPLGSAVRATATGVTVAPRPAMRMAPASELFGRVTIIDIGSPRQLLREFGVPSTLRQ
jgi:hydroxyethylthiazole kinase-like uncharacterized protein yjeF